MVHSSLPRSTPEQQGVLSDSIMSFMDAIEKEQLGIHSLMVVRHGYVIAEGWWKPYTADRPHLLNSLSKSFTSTAIGLAVDEGSLSLDDSVKSYFPEYVTESIADNMRGLKIRHLLSMSTGHSQDTTFTMVQHKSDWAKAFLEIPIEHEPGTYFLYNTGATYMLSAILEKATGQKLLDYLRPKLFEPLGITGVTTISCPQGIHVGGFGMSMTTEDIAKFGQLYLQKGIWHGKRILSEEWVLTATSEQVSNAHSGQGDWSQGYGFQFWRCQHNSYRGDGAFGQFCVVMPEQDAVIAMTAGYMEMQAMLELVWQHLLPGMTNSVQGSNPAIHQALLQRLNDVSYLCEAGAYSSPSEWKDAAVSYSVSPNTAQILEISFSGDDQEVCIALVDANGTSELRAGFGSFCEGEAELDGFRFRYAACGVWRKRNVLEITLYMTELALSDVITCHFVNDSVQISASRNVWVSPILSDMGLMPTIIGSRFKDRDTWIGNTKQ